MLSLPGADRPPGGGAGAARGRRAGGRLSAGPRRTRDRAELARRAAELPDEPRWVDARGFLLGGRAEVVAGEEGWLVLGDDWPLGFVVGRPEEAVLAPVAELEDRPGEEPVHVLAQEADVEGLAERLPAVSAAGAGGWRRDDALLHAWPAGHRSDLPTPPAPYRVRLVAAGEPLDLSAFPADSRRELVLYRTADPWAAWPLAVALADDRAVAVCVTAVATESLWDVGVETVEGHRRRGLAAACFEALRRHHERPENGGRTAVWGAHESNRASLALARRLGFRPAARVACLLAG